MTFKEIAYKNFRANLKKYLSYFLCSSFSIAIFFIYSTLLYNDQLRARDDNDMIAIIFYTALIAVAIFSVFFINYAHAAFVKSRNKEFGVYLSLGMTSGDINRMLLLENSLIILGSLVSGLVTGVVFSRLFQLVVLKLLDYNDIHYALSYKSFILTITVFLVIFGVVIGLSRLSTRKLQISELLKQSRKHEGKPKTGLLPGVLGIAVLLFSVVFLVFISGNENLKSNPGVMVLYLAFLFGGAYLTISFLGRTLISLVRRNKTAYYNQILTVTEIHHKFHQNKNVLFILSILSAMIIFFVASPFSLYRLTGKIATGSQKNPIEYSEVAGINHVTPADLDGVLGNSRSSLGEEKSMEFLALFIDSDKAQSRITDSRPVISQTLYNTVTGSHLSLAPGQAMNIITNPYPGKYGIEAEDHITLAAGDARLSLTIEDSRHDDWVTGSSTYPSDSGLVLNDGDYKKLETRIPPQNIGIYHVFSVKDWKGSLDMTKKMRQTLDSVNEKLTGLQKEDAAHLKLVSRIETYNGLKQGYSLFIFIMTIMGLLFFIASETVLFFKQYADIGSTREKFYKLYKLGISRREAVGVISRELRLTFYSPLVLGSFMGYSLMYFMTCLVGGDYVLKEFMVNATIVVIAYFLLQTAFYFITRNKFAEDVLVHA